MRAAWYERTGAARDVLRVGTLPDPAPGAGEVLVRLRGAMTRERDRATEALIERSCQGLGLAADERARIAALLRHTLIAIRGLFLDTYLSFDQRHFEEQLELLARTVDDRLHAVFAARRRLARAA